MSVRDADALMRDLDFGLGIDTYVPPTVTAETNALIERFLRAADTEDLERRWFVAMAAVESLKDECSARRRTSRLADKTLRSESVTLAQLEAVRDALGERLVSLHSSAVLERSLSR